MSLKKLSIKIEESTSGSIGRDAQKALYYNYIGKYALLLMYQNGWNGSIPNGSHILYKYTGNVSKLNSYTKTTREIVDLKTNKKIDLDAYTIELGGTFLKIGGDNETIGGRNQKVGSDNK